MDSRADRLDCARLNCLFWLCEGREVRSFVLDIPESVLAELPEHQAAGDSIAFLRTALGDSRISGHVMVIEPADG